MSVLLLVAFVPEEFWNAYMTFIVFFVERNWKRTRKKIRTFKENLQNSGRTVARFGKIMNGENHEHVNSSNV